MFAPSSSALAKELGYKGKMTFYRIIKGEVSSKVVEEIWNKLLAEHGLEEEDLYNLAYSCNIVKELYDTIVSEMNTNHSRWVENVITSFVEEVYDYYSDSFKKEAAPLLLKMKKGHPDTFWGMAVLFYLRAKQIDPYKKDFIQTYCSLLEELDSLLFSLHPENIAAHHVTTNLQALCQQIHFAPSLWRLLHDATLLFRYYTEPSFSSTIAKSMRLFDWPSSSYWIVPQTTYHKGEHFWLLVEYDFGTRTNGLYIVLQIEVGKDTETFHVIDTCIFQFWEVVKEEDQPIITRTDYHPKRSDFYLYDYEPEKRLLHFEEIKEMENRHQLPETLYRIDLSNPQGKEEKIWSRICRKFEDGAGKELYAQAVETFFGITELEERYEIKDVLINRSTLSLLVAEADSMYKYEIPLTAYSFLTCINPSHAIIMTKHINEDDIYVEWPSLGYAIKLSAFNCKDL